MPDDQVSLQPAPEELELDDELEEELLELDELLELEEELLELEELEEELPLDPPVAS